MALWPAHSIEAFCHNDGGRPGLDSSLSFPVASNHLRFTAPAVSQRRGEGALIVSCKNSHTLHTQQHSHHTTVNAPAHVHFTSKHTRTRAYARARVTQTFPPALLWLFEAHLLLPNGKAAQSTNTLSFLLSLLNTHTRTHPLTCHQHFIDTRKSFIVRGQKQ